MVLTNVKKSGIKSISRNNYSNMEEIKMDILEVADAFLNLDSMSPKKLQKLCYYAQGWYAGLTGRKLFTNELEAWIHGPVSPKLYEKYKMYGYENIPRKDGDTKDIELKGIIEQIYRIYGKLDGDELEQLTHKETPWLNARNGIESWVPSNKEIKFADLVDFFSKKFREEQINA